MARQHLFQKSSSVDDLFHVTLNLRAIVTDAVEDGIDSATHALKHRRRAAKHAIRDARRAIKRHPLQTAGVVFASGLLTGALVSQVASRRH